MRTLLLVACLIGASAAPIAYAADTPGEADFAAQGQALIDAAQAGAYFSAAPDPSQIVVRHNGSRLVCHLPPGVRGSVHVYDSSANGGPAPGEDVSCGLNPPEGAITLYATRYPQPVTVDDALAESVYEITQVSPQAREIATQAAPDPLEPFHSRTQAFDIPHFMNQAGDFYSRTSVTVIDGWVYLMRFTTHAGPGAAHDGEQAWRRFEADLAANVAPGDAAK